MKKPLLAVLCILLAGSLMGACAASADSAQTAPSAETATQECGALVWKFHEEPDTLDPYKTHARYVNYILQMTGSSLAALAPDGTIVPYGAESWTVSDDGLVWEFKLRPEVKFHNGSPVTAQDYAWTYTRAISPDFRSSAAASLLDPLVSAVALDPLTLRLTLSQPYAPFLYNLTASGYLQPLPQAAFEEMGERAFGLRPIGSGPYALKTWFTGRRIILERNAAYTWGPRFDTQDSANTGPFQIPFIEFRFAKESALLTDELLSGAINFLQAGRNDLPLFADNPDFHLYAQPLQGLNPYIAFNLQQPPLDDIRVRKAFNLAIDRQALIDQILDGQGIIQYGPLSRSMTGYWPGVEEIGYGYDPDRAALYLQEAGYQLGADGLWSKDGNTLTVEFLSAPSGESAAALTRALTAQLRAFGIDARIKEVDSAQASQMLREGHFQAALAGWSYPEADLLYRLFHSSLIGSTNIHRLSDPDLDALLEQSRVESNPALRRQIVNDLQQRLVEDAVIAPLYTALQYYVLSAEIQGEQFSEQFGFTYADACVAK